MKHMLPLKLRSRLDKIQMDWDNLREIRMRCDRPVLFAIGDKELFLNKGQGLGDDAFDPYCVSGKELQECLASVCQYSLYAFEGELQKGYVTIQGGHRVGLSGQVVFAENKVQSISHLSSLNIRIAHSVKGCGEVVFPLLWENNHPCHTLLVSPPGGGKTTLLRDLVRLFSDGYKGYSGLSVSLVDERSEVSACYQGVPQNDVGIRTDIMANCPKTLGVEMMVRSMAPKIVAFDELGMESDMQAVRYAADSGCCVLTTVHGNDWETVVRHGANKVFQRILFLNDRNDKQRICKVVDGEGAILFQAV